MTTRNMNREFPVWNLVNSGKQMQPDKIKITYRYRASATETCNAYVFGLEPDVTKPTLLLSQALLNDSTCPRERYVTTVLELNNTIKIVDMYVVISYYNMLQDCETVTGVCDVVDIKQGRSTTDAEIDCNGVNIPVATDATDITTTGFTANWLASTGATGYKIDVSTDIEFSSFVGSYENYDIPSGSTVSLIVSELVEDTCYFYRVRAYNSTFTSMNSNVIHVGDVVKDMAYMVNSVTENDECTMTYEDGYIEMFADINDGYVQINAVDASTMSWSNDKFKMTCEIKLDSLPGADFYFLRASGANDCDIYIALIGAGYNQITNHYETGSSVTSVTKTLSTYFNYNDTWEAVEIEFNSGVATFTTAKSSYTFNYTKGTSFPTKMYMAEWGRSVGTNDYIGVRNIHFYFYESGEWKDYYNIPCDDGNDYIRYSTKLLKNYRDISLL